MFKENWTLDGNIQITMIVDELDVWGSSCPTKSSAAGSPSDLHHSQGEDAGYSQFLFEPHRCPSSSSTASPTVSCVWWAMHQYRGHCRCRSFLHIACSIKDLYPSDRDNFFEMESCRLNTNHSRGPGLWEEGTFCRDL